MGSKQWGRATTNSYFTLPLAFPNTVFVVVGIVTKAVNTDNDILHRVSNTQVYFGQYGLNTTEHFIAIGV